MPMLNQTKCRYKAVLKSYLPICRHVAQPGSWSDSNFCCQVTAAERAGFLLETSQLTLASPKGATAGSSSTACEAKLRQPRGHDRALTKMTGIYINKITATQKLSNHKE